MSESTRRSLIVPAVYAAVLMAAIILAAAVTFLLKQQAGPARACREPTLRWRSHRRCPPKR